MPRSRQKQQISVLTLSVVLAAMILLMIPASALCAEPLLYDDFEGTALDAATWNTLAGGESITVADGLLKSEGEPNHKRIDSVATFQPVDDTLLASARIKLNGDYQKFGFRVNAGAFAGPTAGFYFDTLETENEDTVTALIWQVDDVGTATKVLSVPIDAAWGEFHTLTIEWSGSEVAFHVDGEEKARSAIAFTNALPIGVWNDRPALMETEWVKIINQIAVSDAVDIKPESEINSINPRNQGVIPVALYSTDSFDAMAVNPETVEFGANGFKTGPAHYSVADINEDGLDDYIFHFKTQQTGIDCETETATLTGETVDAFITGSDSVRPVGCNAQAPDGDTPPDGNGPGVKPQPPAFDDHPVLDSKPGRDNHPYPDTPGHNKAETAQAKKDKGNKKNK